MPISRNARKAVMISAAVFAGLITTAFAGYFVYEHREDIPIIRDFFEDQLETPSDRDVEALPEGQGWTISIEDGNVVKTFNDGSEEILADKEDYDEVEEFSDVAVSPDEQHMCFLAHYTIPVWLAVGDTDGSNVEIGLGLAENCYWSHDSTMVAFTNHTTDVSPHNVFVYFLSTELGTNFTATLSTEHVMRVYENPVWSDDDTTITSMYNAYDDRDEWAHSTGYTIITIATGETRDVASNVDTSDWVEYEDEDSGITLLHPADWDVDEECINPEPGRICSIKLTDGNYIWGLDYDPFVTGGGFGFLFEMGGGPDTSIRTLLNIDGYSPTLLTHYYNCADLAAEMSNPTFPAEGEMWAWSITFTDPNSFGSLGFGPGAMYDQVANNYWSIIYSYDADFGDDAAKDFSEVPLKDDSELDEAILIMNAISESVDLP